MASLVQYTKVGGRTGGEESGPWTCPLASVDRRPTAQPLWLQAPIRESLISLSDEDLDRQAVESFRGEWPSWVLMSVMPRT